VPREEADPEGQERERHHPPGQQDGDHVLHPCKRALGEFELLEVSPHEAVQEPGVRFSIERCAIREHGRESRQVAPQPLQVEVKVEVDGD
jgi:hypothetical protein